MADQEHVDMLKQGVAQWNKWRRQHPESRINLTGADLSGADLSKAWLSGVNLNNADLNDAKLNFAKLSGTGLIGARLNNAKLSGADLRGANLGVAKLNSAYLNHAYLNGANLNEVDLRGANLIQADLSGVSLWHADLRGANLTGAKLNNANLTQANLRETNLSEVDLGGANLNNSDLRGADLRGADLSLANLSQTFLSGANLSGVRVVKTVFAETNLQEVKGLTELVHRGQSNIELHTIQLPQDGSALHFLRGVGVPDEWIDFWRTTAMHPIQYHSLFISYSSIDDTLAHRLHADLQAKGVRCWFAPEDMKIGDKIRSRIDEAIHLHEKLLLLLSEHAIASTWVEDEVNAAIEKEQRQQREVLFPVRLDESVMQTPQAWAAKLRRSRNIGDFTNWTDPLAYQRAFDRLLRDLKKADK